LITKKISCKLGCPCAYSAESIEADLGRQSILMCVQVLRWYGAAFYFVCEVLGLLNAYLFVAVGIWRSVEHMKRHASKRFENNFAIKVTVRGRVLRNRRGECKTPKLPRYLRSGRVHISKLAFNLSDRYPPFHLATTSNLR